MFPCQCSPLQSTEEAYMDPIFLDQMRRPEFLTVCLTIYSMAAVVADEGSGAHSISRMRLKLKLNTYHFLGDCVEKILPCLSAPFVFSL